MMLAARCLQKQSLRSFSSHILPNASCFSRRVMVVRDGGAILGRSSDSLEDNCYWKDESFSSIRKWNSIEGARGMSTKSMRSKVERRMRKESGKTLREFRRAKKLQKKLMTEEERLLHSLRRAKKKVALLLQKLKKYELPELPSPRHDPELLTPEQLQAFKKIGFKNKNYVPVGIRGVFGGVVQNMHMHWKFHETVQVCCDNFPREKIKEMASMLARLSGGIVVNIHNVKTIIMFRGRNYRQPKNLIPINTLTKRKALFKARFEQALESQKLNIKKYEQELRRKGVNPDDPVAMASIQRVASTFFNAIDKKEGSPYVFQADKKKEIPADSSLENSQLAEDSDQEELDKFIAEIEDAADKEWAAEEAAEKEELGKLRYWDREQFGDRLQRFEHNRSEDFDAGRRGMGRGWNKAHDRKRIDLTEDEEGGTFEDDDGTYSNGDEDAGEYESDAIDFGSDRGRIVGPRSVKWHLGKKGGPNGNKTAKSHVGRDGTGSTAKNMLSDLEDAMWESDDGENVRSRESELPGYDYNSSSDEDER